jgi:hypothetical protein
VTLAPCLWLALTAALAPTPQGPVAQFTLDDGPAARPLDTSGWGQHARLLGATWAPGHTGQAISLQRPGDALRIASRRSLQLGQALTLAAWICPGPGGELSRIIVAKNDEYLLRIDKPAEGGRISFFVQVGTPAVSWEPRVSSLAPPAPGVWQHVAATWDGRLMALYLDGKLQATTEHVGLPNPNPYPVMVGNFEYPSCHGGVFGGLLDEIRVYPRALSAQELTPQP